VFILPMPFKTKHSAWAVKMKLGSHLRVLNVLVTYCKNKWVRQGFHCRHVNISQKELRKHFLFTFQVNVCLECMSTNMKTLKRRFIRCSAQATITHLKKFIAKKVLNGTEKYRDVSINFAYDVFCCICSSRWCVSGCLWSDVHKTFFKA
jgi:hypothetical protein